MVLLGALNWSPRAGLSRACVSVGLALLDCCVGAFRATRRAISLLLDASSSRSRRWMRKVATRGSPPVRPASGFYLAAGAEGGRGEPGAGTGPQPQAAAQ